MCARRMWLRARAAEDDTNLKIGRNPVAQVLYITLPRSPKDEIATEGRLFQTHDLATRAAIVSKVKPTQQLSNLVSVAACRKW